MSEYGAMLRTLVAGRDLDREATAWAIGDMLEGAWSGTQTAAFLAALAAKGETCAEVIGAAEAMRAHGLRLEHALSLVVDTCGTGGDGAGTINISTIAAFIVAGCGLPVAKHGNRAASSRCGSADVLEASGIPIDVTRTVARQNLEHERFAFLFAPSYYPGAKEVAPIRRELGIRTIFNLLGPLTNPAHATHQVIGVAASGQLELVAEALATLGVQAGAVVHATSGIDEIAGDVPTEVFQFDRTGGRRWVLDPASVGVTAPADALAGGPPAENARALRAILEGERSPRVDVVALNAAMVLLVAGHASDLADGLMQARASLSSGAALAIFECLRHPTELELA